jgi:hypothetical protein
MSISAKAPNISFNGAPFYFKTASKIKRALHRIQSRWRSCMVAGSSEWLAKVT